MEKGQQGNGYSSQLNDLADLIAWQGYEFWSAQIEAEMEYQANFEQSDFEQRPGQLEPKEGKSDVFPF